MPCGYTISPEPNALTKFPSPSNFQIGAASEPRQMLAPQRSAIQIDLPSLSIAIALADPRVRPCGILKNASFRAYGFGRALSAAERIDLYSAAGGACRASKGKMKTHIPAAIQRAVP